MKIVKSGEEFIHILSNGEAMLYQASDDPINPVKLVKTLSPEEVKNIKQTYAKSIFLDMFEN